MMDPYLRLSLAIVIRAMVDIKKQPCEKLSAWLLKEGFFILEVCKIPITWEIWQEFVRAGCPGEISRREIYDN